MRFAKIQHELGIRGSYYFRIVPQSLPDRQAGFNPKIIEQIAGLGHEIGYHYEDIDFALQNNKTTLPAGRQEVKSKPSLPAGRKTKEEFEKELAEKAIELFEKNLTELRKYFPVKTICMHGSPLSKYDNKLLWKYYNYKDFGIIGEPYFDVDFNKVLYLTDTGRRWNGDAVSIRDKVKSKKAKDKSFKKTADIIRATEKGELPEKIMFTFHPQRWTDKPVPWIIELVWQNAKNIVKYFLNKVRK